jgi:hypothetical protein
MNDAVSWHNALGLNRYYCTSVLNSYAVSRDIAYTSFCIVLLSSISCISLGEELTRHLPSFISNTSNAIRRAGTITL